MSFAPSAAPELGRCLAGDAAHGPLESVLPEGAEARVCRAKGLPLHVKGVSKWRLLDELRPLSAPRTRACRRRRISATVQLQSRADGSKRVSGVLSCGSVWACPVCAQRICSHRADELKSALESWKVGAVSMLSLTVRHALGHDLRKVRRGVAGAWRRLWQGRKAKELRALFHVKHMVRALEVTHGENGWHPHLHVLLFSSCEPEPGALEYLQGLWIDAVTAELGSDHTPDWTHGSVLTKASGASYLQKMGLEISHSFTKKAGRSSRTPWDIAQDAAEGDEASARLWRYYCKSMKGARQLTWSRGMRRFFGLGLRDSDAAVIEADDKAGGSLVALWEGADWDAASRSDPFWVSRIASVEDWEVARLPGARRAPLVEDLSPPSA